MSDFCRSGLEYDDQSSRPICPNPVISEAEAYALHVRPMWCRSCAERLSRIFHSLNPQAAKQRKRDEAHRAAVDDAAAIIAEQVAAAGAPLPVTKLASMIGRGATSRLFREAAAKAEALGLVVRPRQGVLAPPPAPPAPASNLTDTPAA